MGMRYSYKIKEQKKFYQQENSTEHGAKKTPGTYMSQVSYTQKMQSTAFSKRTRES